MALLSQWFEEKKKKKNPAYIGSGPHDIIKPGVVCQPEVTLGVVEEVVRDDAASVMSRRGKKNKEVSW